MLLLYRHGARYPTSDAAPDKFAQKLVNQTKAGGLGFSGELSFLSDWTYKLGAELLTPFGRSQLFMLGVSHRQLYGSLLNNFTAAGTLPVFRTQSQDRMVKTAENFAAGFFGGMYLSVCRVTSSLTLTQSPSTWTRSTLRSWSKHPV